MILRLGSISALLAVSLHAQSCPPALALAPNESLASQLDSQNCRLADNTSFQDYAIVFPVRGALTITLKGTTAAFAPVIILRDSEGHRLDGGATVTRTVEAGRYHVIVNSPQNGKFTLASTFVPEPNLLCHFSRNLGVGQVANSQLTANSCKLFDKSAFEAWQLTVFGAGTLTISMTSADFDSYLILRGDDGTEIAFDDNGGGGLNASISMEVGGNTTYTIVAAAVNAAQKAGKYQLSTSFTPADGETCVSQQLLTDSAAMEGSVSSASCSVSLPGQDTASLFNFYNLHVATAGTVQFQVPASNFTPLLQLMDANGTVIASDAASGGPYIPLILQQLPPGDYLLLVFNEDSFDGTYTLQYNFTPASVQNCSVQSLSGDTVAAGAISGSASCRTPGLLSDFYAIQLPVSGTLDINMSSGDFTTFLELHDAKDNVLAYGMQTPDGASSHMLLDLPAGTYYVISASLDLPGNYSLYYQLNPKTIPACPKGPVVALNTGYIGQLGNASCTGPDGRYVDSYSFTTSADGNVAAFLVSGEFATQLTMTDSAGKEIRMDAGSYSQANSVIVQFLKAGTYRLEARGGGSQATGLYRVDVLFTAGAKSNYCLPQTMSMNSTKSMSIGYTGCQYVDDTFSQILQFTVTNGTKPVSILASAIFDDYLILLDSRGNLLAEDDNSGQGAKGSDALITSVLKPGVYYAVVKPADSPSSSGNVSVKISQ